MTDEKFLDVDVELFRKLFRPAPTEAAGLDELADGFPAPDASSATRNCLIT